MTIVFLSGSRKINRINDTVRSRVQNMIDQNFQIVVGDANGADKALQVFLDQNHYRNVTVFCAGTTCRNNVGDWQTDQVLVDKKLSGRDFYTEKDKKMAAVADYGFVLWDGKSAGSINNVFELLKRGKKVVVYLSPKKEFLTITEPHDVDSLLQNCDSADYLSLNKKINMRRHMDDLHSTSQGSFSI
ncbi:MULTISPECIES: hypothetical protein [unclassified Pararhizobium]|uniref:hypothetical protein n=1 Tax=unclassified Pararhizobium TaxID=2643050 RepID=UPI002740A51D|nr:MULTISPECIES: hypothetical protein [unclassified Pararhizobium]